jgi:signal transduction histidine kinase
VPEHALEEIFAPFCRLDPSRRQETGGVGLGLAICRAIINAHGGRIWVENREGGGAVFRFTLSGAGVPEAPEQEEVGA